jgi:nitronate monooxygenase
MLSVSTELSRLCVGNDVECPPRGTREQLVQVPEVVIERDRNRELVGVGRKTDGAANVLIMRVKIGHEVTPRLVPERSQPGFEARRLTIPFRDHLAEGQPSAALHLHGGPCRPSEVVGLREALRVEIRGEADDVGEHVPDRPGGRRRNLELQLLMRQRDRQGDELAPRAFVQAPGVDIGGTRQSRVLHPTGLAAEHDGVIRRAAMQTAFTELVGCRYPLQQAAMGGVGVPALAGAVARAGGLGMLCEFDVAPAADRMTETLSLAGEGKVGMGFFGHWIDNDLETFEIAAGRLSVVEVFWSVPDPLLVGRARAAGSALVAWQVGSLDDALAAEDAGCDFVVAQGVEAGGHVRGIVPRDELLRAVLARVSIPVVAAGGIATASDVADTIAAGAAAVRVGTAFVATEESGAHPAYIEALTAARSGDDTVLTTTFSVGWPDAPHRVLRSAVAAAEAFDRDVVGEAGARGSRYPVPRFGVAAPTPDVEGHVEAMALYAGTGVGHVTGVRPAAEVVAELTSALGTSRR